MEPLSLTYWIVLAAVCALLTTRKKNKTKINKQKIYDKTHADSFSHRRIPITTKHDLERIISDLLSKPEFNQPDTEQQS